MNHLKKQRIKQACNLTSLILASLPLVLEFRNEVSSKNKNEPEDPNLKTLDKAFWILLMILALITYWTSYYALSSLFWPEPLSVTNHLLLIPCTILTGITIYDRGSLLLKTIYEKN